MFDAVRLADADIGQVLAAMRRVELIEPASDLVDVETARADLQSQLAAGELTIDAFSRAWRRTDRPVPRRLRSPTSSGVPVDHVPGQPVDQDPGDPAHLGEGAGQCRPLGRRMGPPVARVGHELIRGVVPAPTIRLRHGAIAVEHTGRRCPAIELDPLYVGVAIERWQAFTGRTAEPVRG